MENGEWKMRGGRNAVYGVKRGITIKIRITIRKRIKSRSKSKSRRRGGGKCNTCNGMKRFSTLKTGVGVTWGI